MLCVFSMHISDINNMAVLFQNHPQRYEKLICFHYYTATTNEKFVGSSGI